MQLCETDRFAPHGLLPLTCFAKEQVGCFIMFATIARARALAICDVHLYPVSEGLKQRLNGCSHSYGFAGVGRAVGCSYAWPLRENLRDNCAKRVWTKCSRITLIFTDKMHVMFFAHFSLTWFETPQNAGFYRRRRSHHVFCGTKRNWYWRCQKIRVFIENWREGRFVLMTECKVEF